jgi:translocation and assembly module TamA
MSGIRAAAALALLCGVLAAGCAQLRPPATPAPAADPALRPDAGVRVEIVAPPELQALLERHLDLVRLGRIAREEVDDSEWSRLIEATPAQVRELLETEGYFRPRVSLDRAAGRSAGEPERVRLQLDPGPRARVSRVTLEAEGELGRSAAAGDARARTTVEQMQQAWELPAGRDFRNPAWSDAKAAALARLRSAGYATAAWSGTGAEVDVEGNAVRLFAVVDSGPLFRLGRLDVEGLFAHDLQTVVNLAVASRGTPVTETLLLDFQDRLQKSGLFETASVTLDPDPAQAAAARVLVRLREAPLQVYTFGLGVSANTGPRASVEHQYRRVFGWAASSRVKIEVGKLRQAWDGEISTHPGPGLYRNLIGGAVERLVSDTDVVLSQRVRLGRTQDGQRIERLFYAEAERSLRVIKAGDRNNAFALSFNFHGGWRNLDSIVLPTDGQTLSIELGAGRSDGTGAVPGIFGRAYGRLTGYWPLGRTWYGQARIELGRVFLRQNMVVTESQKFRAGGDDSVRGYSYRSLGPIVDGAVGGGTALFTASAELARPFLDSMPSLWGAVFADAGNAADDFRQLRPAVGLGVGLRWRSPAGPLRVDWAWGRETHKGRLHFSVGIAF